MKYSLPIHVIIGYKLNYIVVQDKNTAKILFNHNCFNKSNRKVTILPLEDIVIGNTITSIDIQYCRTFCGVNENDNNNITYYMDVIKFNPEFMGLAQYIMGNVVFCSKSEYARKIAYDMKKYTAVTLEGDKYDRNGSMSGGSNRGLNLILEKIYKLNEIKLKLKEVQDEIDGRKILTEEITSSNEEITSDDINSILHTLLHEEMTSDDVDSINNKLINHKKILNEKKLSLTSIINADNVDSINNKLINHKKILNERKLSLTSIINSHDVNTIKNKLINHQKILNEKI